MKTLWVIFCSLLSLSHRWPKVTNTWSPVSSQCNTNYWAQKANGNEIAVETSVPWRTTGAYLSFWVPRLQDPWFLWAETMNTWSLNAFTCGSRLSTQGSHHRPVLKDFFGWWGLYRHKHPGSGMALSQGLQVNAAPGALFQEQNKPPKIIQRTIICQRVVTDQ